MKQILSLDGTWQVIFDHDNKGRMLNWQHQGNFYKHHDIEQAFVPACLEEFRQDYEGAAWYGKIFTLPTDWKSKTIIPRGLITPSKKYSQIATLPFVQVNRMSTQDSRYQYYSQLSMIGMLCQEHFRFV